MRDMEFTIREGYDREFCGVPELDHADQETYPVFAHRTTPRGSGNRPGMVGSAVLYKDPLRLEKESYNVNMDRKMEEVKMSAGFAERCTIPEESTLINPKGRSMWKSGRDKFPKGPRIFTRVADESDSVYRSRACCQDGELLRGKVCKHCNRHSLSGKLENMRGSFGVSLVRWLGIWRTPS